MGTCFVLGDNRKKAVDIRATNFGRISEEEMVGKTLVQVWPLNSLTWYSFWFSGDIFSDLVFPAKIVGKIAEM